MQCCATSSRGKARGPCNTAQCCPGRAAAVCDSGRERKTAAARQQMRFARVSNRAFTQRCNCYFIVKFKAASSTRTLSGCPCCRATSNEDAPLKLLRGSAPDKSSCEIQAAWSLELFCAATKIGDAPSLSHLLTSPAAAASCAMIDAWPFWAAT